MLTSCEGLTDLKRKETLYDVIHPAFPSLRGSQEQSGYAARRWGEAHTFAQWTFEPQTPPYR